LSVFLIVFDEVPVNYQIVCERNEKGKWGVILSVILILLCDSLKNVVLFF